MSNTLDEKVRAPSDDEKSSPEYQDTARGYGGLPDDPDAGLSIEERAAIVRTRTACHWVVLLMP
jgi:hypothetical protein